jgi:Tfp pilus assembly protein PilO
MTLFNIAVPAVPTTALRGLIPLAMLTVLSIAGATLVYALGLSPAEQHLVNAEQAFQSAKQAQAALQGARTQQARARSAQQQLDLVRQALPSHEEFTPLAMALTELGKSEHVAIPGMGYDIKKSEEGQPAKATIAFRASGDYASVYRFIHRLETVDPYVVIESLDVAREQTSKSSSSARIVVNIKVATYLRQVQPTVKSS